MFPTQSSSKTGDSFSLNPFGLELIKTIKEEKDLELLKKELLEKYDKVVSKYNQMIFNRSMENQQLTKLRDWLLPMLMNGQVTVA